MWNLLLPVLGGALISGYFNSQAANTAANAAAQQAATQNAIAERNQAIAAPAQSYLRSVVASSDTLTPAQVAQLAENRKAIANEIHGSGFAGSGETAAALFKRQDSDFINSALDSNQRKAIGAADTLAGRATAADTAALAAAQTTDNGALYGANANLASGKVYGQAVGDIASLINRQSKLQTLS